MIRSLASLLVVLPVFGLLLKVTLLLLLGWSVAGLLRRASAAARHFVWMLALTGSVALTVTAPFVPAVPIRIAAWTIPSPAVLGQSEDKTTIGFERSSAREGLAPTSSAVTPVPTAGRQARFEIGGLLVALYLLGALGVAGWCLIGHLGLARLVRRATPLSSPEWQRLLQALTIRSGIKTVPRLLRSSAVGSPVTWGLRPVVLLPEDADAWPSKRRRVVLAHELAHIARGDYLAQLAAGVACAIYWFHPLAWVAARRLRSESERASDDQVLVRGTPGVEYAAHLLDVARGSQLLRPGGMVAIGMARPSHLEGRLLAVLDPARTRRAPRARGRAAGWGGLALLVLPLAVIRPAPRPVSGAPSDTPEDHRATRTTSVVNLRPESPKSESRVAANTVPPPADSMFERSVEAAPGGELDLDLESGGSVLIRAWDEPRVTVRGRLAGPDWRDTRVSLERTGDGILLHSWQEAKRRSSSTSHAFEIEVPRRFDVRLSSAGGSITIIGLEGTFSGETGGGEITIEKASGRATLSTGGGTVRVSDSNLGGSVSTGGGMVSLNRVKGGLRGRSGSGPVIYTDGGREAGETGDLKRVTVERGEEVHVARHERGEASFGMLHITKAGGPILLDAAPEGAELRTGGGEIRVGPSSGNVRAYTGGGNIEIGPASGSVSATTGAGEVRVTITGADGKEHSVEVSSGRGSVVIELPENLSARFDLETAYTENFGRRTRITSDWSLSQEETERWDDTEGTPRKYVRARGVVGDGGGLIKVRIVNGDVTIRRGRR